MNSKSINTILRKSILIISIAIFTGITSTIIISEYYKFLNDYKHEKQLIEDEKKVFLKIAVKNVKSYLKYIESSSEKMMNNKLRNAVNNAISQAQIIYELNKDSRTDEEIKELIRKTLSEVRYFDGRGYIYLIDIKGQVQMHAFNQKPGKNMVPGIPDSKFKYLIKKQINKLNGKNENFFSYEWPKPWTKDSTLYKKNAFIKRFKPYNWIIGCGEYSDHHLIETQNEALNYLNNSYSAEDWNLFINHYDGTSIIINSSKYKAGINIKDISDDNGLDIFREEIKISKSGNPDYLRYNWPINDSIYIPKLAYIDRFDKWNWMIGASSSLEKFDRFELQKIKSFYKVSWIRIVIILLLSIPFIILILYQLRKSVNIFKLDFNMFFNQIEDAVLEKKSDEIQTFKITEFNDISTKVDLLLSKHFSNIKALKESEEKFRILVEHAPLAIVGLDSQGKIQIWNKQSEKLFKLNKNDVLHKNAPINILFDGEMKNSASEKMFDNDPEFKLIPIHLKNGKMAFQYWASFRISESLIIWVGNDVTDLKEIEKELVKSRNFLDILLESIPSPVFYKNILGQYLGGNKAFFELLNKNKEDVIGKDVDELFPEELAKVYFEKDQEVFQGKSQQYDFIYGQDKDNIRNFTYYKAPYKNPDHKIEGLIGVMLDITDRIRFEEELKKKQVELKALNATKDRFFSIIAHDLINPFNVMLNAGKLLAESVKNDDMNGIKEMTNLLNPSIKNTYELLRNLLEWSRSQTGSIQFSPKRINVCSELTVVIELMSVMANAKSISLDYKISENTEINVDVNMFRTIARNLISNAIKFTPNEGRVSVKTSFNNNYLKIDITDNGVGMNQITKDNLFEIDKGISKNGTNQEPGTGLGLLLVNDFIKKHKGKIIIDSAIDVGTSVSVLLPIDE